MSAIVKKEVEYFKGQVEHLNVLKEKVREFAKKEDVAIIIAKNSYLTDDVFSYSPKNISIIGKFEHLNNLYYLIAFKCYRINIKENYKEISEYNPVSSYYFRSIEEWEYEFKDGIIKKEAKYLYLIDNQPVYTEILYNPRQDKYAYIHKHKTYGEEAFEEEALNKIKEKVEIYQELTREESIKEIEGILDIAIRYCKDKIHRLEALDQIIELLKCPATAGKIKLYDIRLDKERPEKSEFLFKIKETNLLVEASCLFNNNEFEIDIYQNCEKVWSISATTDNGILKDIWISPNYVNVDATYLSKDEIKQFQPLISAIHKNIMSTIKKLKPVFIN